MRITVCFAFVCALAARPAAAQCPGSGTVGVASVNNLTVEGAGGLGSCGAGTAKCLPPGPLILDLFITAAPGDIVVGAFAPSTSCCTSTIDATYSLDLPLAGLVVWYNLPFGTGTPGFPLTSTLVNGAGQWALSMSVDVPAVFAGALQFGLVGPGFSTGLGTTQAISIPAIPAPPASALCPGTVSLTALTPAGMISDDGAYTHTFPPGATFPFYGTAYAGLVINMNGNITFCSGDTDFSPTECEFIDDQARIAPAWSDWTPTPGSPAGTGTQGDSVRLSSDGITWCVEWRNVRHFGTQCTGIGDFNNFAAMGDHATGVITFLYGAMSRCATPCGPAVPATDQIVGISPGYSERTGTATIGCGPAPAWGVAAPAGCAPGLAGGLTTPVNNLPSLPAAMAGGYLAPSPFHPIYHAYNLAGSSPVWDLGPSVSGPVVLTFTPTGGPGVGPYAMP